MRRDSLLSHTGSCPANRVHLTPLHNRKTCRPAIVLSVEPDLLGGPLVLYPQAELDELAVPEGLQELEPPGPDIDI
jgi:hypothetical protein